MPGVKYGECHALTSTTEAGREACMNKCDTKLSKEVEICINKNPIPDSDGRIQCNDVADEANETCNQRCRVIAEKCYDKCKLRSNIDWESCVVRYKGYKSSKRIKCINTVDNARYKCGALC
ncbi:hypothetical protein DFQ27_003951 [Actinomortierella ambigua]|uniref:Uncharacterized protein n=1 Tax=Actinomortierella ambigua TaxID=1343610 RepID=A0A9P6Q6F7_9FUNG|nr:hypothetical protein DFQ27_003951 [Actinomortierella ambigua]